MSKKWSIGIVCMLIMALLAACGSSNDSNSGKGNGSEQGGEKPVLKQLGFQRNFDPNQDKVAAFLEEKTGYKVKYETLPLENPDDKLNLLMANNEPYDIVKLSGTQYNRLAVQGALEPLDKLLEEFGPDLLKANPSELFDNAKVDGQIYGIPEKHPRGFVGSALAINQKLLDELGMQVPTTIDEFYELLKAIKEKKGIVPLTGFESIIPEISGAFGVVTSFDVEDGKLIHRLEGPGMKEYLAFMNKLYSEGLADPEWPVNKAETIQQKFTTGKAGMMTYGWGVAPAVTEALHKNDPDATITLITSLKGENGEIGNWVQGGGVSWYIAIPKSSKNKEEAMKYMNMKVQTELFKELAIGEEGVHYEKDSEDRMFPILPAFNDDRGNSDWFMTSTDAEAFEELWLLRVRKDPVLYATFEEIQAKQMPISRSDPTLLAPPLPVVANNLQKLNKLESDYMIKVMAGAESIDLYDKFVADWKAQGGADVLAELTEWYESSK
ncbi:extracellular solute-binding protein [Paenibacillus sp. 1011MAR3C5]|uniref:extracellular solute-binding protein n=1 Tax=Paenibacillus sp. 1011MAR3C5 TaxID=1675787 RepID=UPI000E6B8F76|nr:extracellular solute-binding protein [Paenibacillus sp. 1011MAR3C5]RJE83968.1 extracellular solute-binding protein [Paenibacillus sp. 1011MAR3C5]